MFFFYIVCTDIDLLCVLFAAIKVNCNGFCGITNKVNDTAWTVEEQYFNSTVAVADKGTLMNTCNANYKTDPMSLYHPFS